MGKRNGFTLIELLAIIVILAIIAVITVPIILGIIDNSKKGAAIDSAYGYKDAVNRYYVTKSLENTHQEFPSGYKFVSDMPSDFDVFGKKPTDGWVKLNKGSVEEFSLKFGDYVVNMNSSKVIEAIRDGEIVLTPDQQLIKDMKDKALAYVNDLKVAKGTVTNLFNLPVDSVSSIDVTNGWVALINGDAIGYSLQVGDYVVTYDGEIVSVVKGNEIASSDSATQSIFSHNVDTYIKAVLADNSSINSNVVKSVSELSTTINQPSTGWIEFDYNSALVVKDYSLKYGDTNVNYLSLTNDKYVSSFDGVLRSRPIRMTEGILDGNVRYYTGQSGATKDNSDNIVYFDPTSNVGKCSESDYNTANSTQGYNGMSPTWGKTTCLRWYVYSIDNNGTPDDDSDDLVNMILDHNTTSGKSWSGSSNYTGPSSTFLTQLQTDTSGWTSSKLQNPKSYSVSWSNGGSNRSYSIDYLNDYGIKARLIEANEVARIAGKTWWTISSNYFSDLPSYLYANLSQTSRNTNEGYWTSSPDAGNSYYDFAWLVRYDSYMSRGNTGSSLYGIRPVITVLKSDIFS